MTIRDYKVARGDRVDAKISGQDKGKAASGTGKDAQGRGGAFDVGEDDDVLVHRKPANISFYDLGTRLRSVPSGTTFNGTRVYEWPNTTAETEPAEGNTSEYVELALEVDGEMVEHGSIIEPPWWHEVVITDDDWATLTDMLLGSRKPLEEDEEPSDVVDPFGFSTANGSSRRLPHCAELWADNLFYQPVSFHVSGRDIAFTLNPDVFTEEAGYELPYTLREAKPEDEDERWNQNNVAGGMAFNQLVAPKGFFEGSSGPVKIDNAFPHYQLTLNIHNYHGFDTADTVKYKVTNEPSYAAEAVTYSFKGKDNRFYLRPRVMGLLLFSGTPTGGFILTGDWAGRAMPAYPRINNNEEPNINSLYRCVVSRSQYSQHAELIGPNAFLAAIKLNVGEHFGTPTACLALRQGSLAGVIGQGSKLFYVWANQDIRDGNGNDYGVLVPNAVVLGTCSY